MMASALSAELSAITLPSLRPHVTSAWHGHLTFAHWLVQAVKPRVIVELGTHNGLSYSAFCSAISALQLDAKCYAIDTWEGDVHAGAYSNDVHDDLAKFSLDKFPDIGVMVRSYFDDALPTFEDGSVDILHIDGLHTYEAVRHDFESWKPKLSGRAVVLFHDTEVRGGDFGVWKFWGEISPRYPNFRFLHHAGLGVLAVGADQPKDMLDLCASTASEAEALQEIFERASHTARIFGQHMLAEEANRSAASSGINLARNKPVTQSSRLVDGSVRHSPTDGIKDGTYGFHTTQESQPWVMIDLREVKSISRIVVFNRMDDVCAERARNLCAAVSENGMYWENIHNHDGSLFGGIDGRFLAIPAKHQARFVRLWLNDTNFFHLDQVEVY